MYRYKATFKKISLSLLISVVRTMDSHSEDSLNNGNWIHSFCCLTSLTEPKINRVLMYSLELLLSQLSASIINAFKLWCQRKLLRVPWTAGRSNQSFLKGINPECSLGALILKLQYFGHLMRRTDSLEKTPMLRKIGSDRGWDGWMASLTPWTWVWADSWKWWKTGKPGVL